MTTAQHTQGPWTINKADVLKIKIYAAGDHLCDLTPLDECTSAFELNEDNANLIAAAPDLLEALESVLNETPVETIELHPVKWVKIRAAIAKARVQS